MSDPAQLSRMVRNLLENAVIHASARVSLTLLNDGRAAVFTVLDDGPGIEAADRERVFERFLRLDAARVRGSGGAGLGVAITRDIVERHGGMIFVDPTSEAGACFVVRLLLAGRSPAPAVHGLTRPSPVA